MKTEDTVESKMRDILEMSLGETSVFKISLWRTDHTDVWWAGVELRGEYGGIYSTDATVVGVLSKLENILKSRLCPNCGKYDDTRDMHSYSVNK